MALCRPQYSFVAPRPFQIWHGRIGHQRGYFRASIADPVGREASPEGGRNTVFHERNVPPGHAGPRLLELFCSTKEGVRQVAIGRGRARNARRLVQDRYTLRGRRNSQPEVDVPLVRGGAVRGPCARGASGGLVGVRYGEGGGSQGALRENLAPPSQRCEGVHHTGRRHAALLNFMRLMGRQARRLRLSEDQQRWISVWISGYRAARRGRSFSDFMAAGSTRERDHTIIPGPHKGIAQICYSPMLEGFISGWPCSRERVIPDSPSSPVEGESC